MTDAPDPAERAGRLLRPLSPATVLVCLAVAFALAGWWVVAAPGVAPAPDVSDPLARQALLDAARRAWGVALEPARIPREWIVPSPMGYEGVPALTGVPAVPANQSEGTGEDHAAGEWVAGVALGGEARAWPIGLLANHGCVNDTLAGEPIAVFFDQDSGALGAFSRRAGGAIRTFGMSGLQINAAALLHDRVAPPAVPSLWSPALLEGVTGSAAGVALRPIDLTLATWGSWRRDHPATSIAATNLGFRGSYDTSALMHYLKGGQLPEDRLKPTGRRPDLAPKDEVVVVRVGEAERAYALPDIARAGGRIRDKIGVAALTLTLTGRAPLAGLTVDAPVGVAVERRGMLWFAWDGLNPDGDLWQPDK